MKTILIVFGMIFSISSISMFAGNTPVPIYNLSIENQEVISSDLHFDIFIQNTDKDKTFYFAWGSFYIDFNNQYFKNPTIVCIPADGTKFTTDEYSIKSQIANNASTLSLSVYGWALSFENYDSVGLSDVRIIGEMNDKIEVIPAGKKVKIGHYILSGISDTNGNSGLKWHFVRSSGDHFNSDCISYVKYDSTELNNIGRWLPKFPAPANLIDPPDISLKPTGTNGVSDVGISSTEFSLFPNPAFSSFVLRCAEQAEPVRVQVFSTLGALVLDSKVSVSGGEAVVALPIGLADGVYTVLVESGKERHSLLLNILR